MSDVVIRVENVSKQYRLGEVGTGTLSHDLNRWWYKVRGKEDPYLKIGETNDRTKASTSSDYVWSLKDVSFDVKRGEVLGVIGRNGAGKSTLLKILSRVTMPTTGHVKGKGRIASLLEVGTGFNPELTGRDNIYLNGAILGMRKREIDSKFDEIVAFAEVERYIDTPVKRYSSGMYVRLAFAVAAHLEPEILIVDEVLAVGDAEFQSKCMGKMQDVANGGRTVLFVSHNITAIATLCTSCLWLDKGRIFDSGPAQNIIRKYSDRQLSDEPQSHVDLTEKARTGSGAARFTTMKLEASMSNGDASEVIKTGCQLTIELDILGKRPIKNSNVAVTIYDMQNYRLIDINTALKGEFLELEADEAAKVVFNMHDLLLRPGRYIVELWLGRGGMEDIDFVKNACIIEVHPDLAEAKHTELYPGTYQCRFMHDIVKSRNAIPA